ncbi:MAG: hypothetical protein O2954_10060 [bacterium]|nr:hypothetical protein [bacterium]
MNYERFKDPRQDPRWRISQWKMVLLAVGISVLVTIFAWVLLFLREIWTARPLG